MSYSAIWQQIIDPGEQFYICATIPVGRMRYQSAYERPTATHPTPSTRNPKPAQPAGDHIGGVKGPSGPTSHGIIAGNSRAIRGARPSIGLDPAKKTRPTPGNQPGGASASAFTGDQHRGARPLNRARLCYISLDSTEATHYPPSDQHRGARRASFFYRWKRLVNRYDSVLRGEKGFHPVVAETKLSGIL